MNVRIMCRGEDGMEFCVENNIPEHKLDDAFSEAEDNYPCGQLWTENEDSYQQAARAYESEETLMEMGW